MFRFADPLFLLLFIPLFGLFHPKMKSYLKPVAFRFNVLYPQEKSGGLSRLLPAAVRILLMCFLIISLARPQLVNVSKTFNTEGINIMLVFDVSGSMKASDFSPNRFEAARKVLKKFISGRTNDRIGLTVFSGEAYTACPLTVDYDILTDFLDKVSQDVITDGTAIGDALGVALSHIREAPGKSKVIILLTDGENNAGAVAPSLASKWASEEKIKVYTIGVGSAEGAEISVTDQFGRVVGRAFTKLDEKLLRDIALSTEARYYNATDNKSLEEVYREIDSLEKSRVSSTVFYNYKELFMIPLLISLFMWFILFWHEEVLLRLP